MIYLNWYNLILFLPQYFIGIIVAIYVFRKLTANAPVNNMDYIAIQKFNKYIENEVALSSDFYALSEKLEYLPELTFSKFVNNINKNAGQNNKPAQAENSTLKTKNRGRVKKSANAGTTLSDDLLVLSNKLIISSDISEPAPKFIEHIKNYSREVSYLDSFTKKLADQLEELDLSLALFLGLITMLTVLLWAGIVLILTPYPQVTIFTPHFSYDLDLVLNFALAISLFIALVSIFAFFVMSTRKNIVMSLLLVIAGVTVLFFLPAMNWLKYTLLSNQITIYMIVAALALTITYLIFKIRSKKRNFMISLYFSYIAFVTFNLILTYNLVTFIMVHRG